MSFICKSTTRYSFSFFLLFFTLLFFLSTNYVHAQEFISLSGIPEFEKAVGTRDIGGYLNMLYTMIVSAGALLAVIKIALAGVSYSMSDIVTSKESAKKDIQGALLGLAILLIPYIVLATIYPGLVNFNFLNNVQPAEIPPQEGSTQVSNYATCTWGTLSGISTKEECEAICKETYKGLFEETAESVLPGRGTSRCYYTRAFKEIDTVRQQCLSADVKICQEQCTKISGTFDPLKGYCSYTPVATWGDSETLENGDIRQNCEVNSLPGKRGLTIAPCLTACKERGGVFHQEGGTDDDEGYCEYSQASIEDANF